MNREGIPGKIDVLAEVRKLNLPAGEYIVFGSGILGVLGIRDSEDIDLMVTPELFEQLKVRGWKEEVVQIEGRPRIKVTHGVFEAHKDYWSKRGDFDTRKIISQARMEEGIPFMTLHDLADMKRDWGREIDLQDVRLIEEYLQKNPEDR